MTRLLAHTPITLTTENGRKLATATVVEHTDDSADNDLDVAEQVLTVRTADRRKLILRRPLAAEGDGWSLAGVGAVVVGGAS